MGFPPRPTLAAGFGKKPQPFNSHALVHSLAHIIHRERGRRRGGESLHLHARLAVAAHPGRDVNLVAVTMTIISTATATASSTTVHIFTVEREDGRQFDRDVRQHDGVAQRDPVRRPLGSHDAREASRAQDVALLDAVLTDQARRRGVGEVDGASGAGGARGDLLVGDVDHVCRAGGVCVGKSFLLVSLLLPLLGFCGFLLLLLFMSL